jgi:hypothetical protein
LCLQERPLQRSHVLPELLYRPLYGQTHRIRVVWPDVDHLHWLKKGRRERLLCEECEQRIAEYESYFAATWFGPTGLPASVPKGVDVTPLPVDYRKFKLFHLSVIWRSSVSALPEFRDVRLGPHEERMRSMLLAGDASSDTTYPIAGLVLLRPDTTSVHSGIVSVPSRIRNGSGSVYRAAYAGCLWLVYLSGPFPPNYVLHPDGSLRLHAVDLEDVPVLSEAWQRSRTLANRSSK